MKYIFVSGGVISGIGKGVVSASISLLLKNQGFKVTPIKCENYLNVDSGLINPIEHGDPFLCNDGTEADMDMGRDAADAYFQIAVHELPVEPELHAS